MIKIEVISANAVKIKAPEKLKADDFLQIAPQIDFSPSESMGKSDYLLMRPNSPAGRVSQLLKIMPDL